jgi:hypothetical protein
MDNRKREDYEITDGGELLIVPAGSCKGHHDDPKGNSQDRIRKSLKIYPMRIHSYTTMNYDDATEWALKCTDDTEYVLSKRELEEIISSSMELGAIHEKLSAIDASLSSWERRIDERIKRLDSS